MDNVINFDYESHNPKLQLNDGNLGITPEDITRKSHNGMAIRKSHSVIPEKTDQQIYDLKATAILFAEKEKFTVVVGGTKKLHVNVTPAGANVPDLVWESSVPEVTCVDQDGVVYTLKPGVSKISATSATNNSLRAEIEITVSEEEDGGGDEDADPV